MPVHDRNLDSIQLSVASEKPVKPTKPWHTHSNGNTGAGLSTAEIRKINKTQKLSIPVADYVPKNVGGIVVSQADKLA